ncbi:MAG: PAS domain S-box protein [Coriobacteriia bacterium]|nr:PAS domain S-box protein [Coriobacteriia bacterium]
MDRRTTGEDTLREVTSALDEGIFVVDGACRLVFMNATAERLLGWTEDDLLGTTNVHEVIHKSGEPPVPSALEKCRVLEVARSGAPYRSDDETFVRKDGSTFPVSLVVTPLVEDGVVTSAIVVFSDITRDRVAQQALRRSEANYHALFNAVNDAIFVHDAETGAILDVNRKTTEMYGYTPDEARQRTVADLSADVPPYTIGRAVERVRKAAAGEPQLFEWLAKDRSGRQFWVEVNLKHVALGERDRVVATVRDVSGRKRAEEALREKDRAIRRAYTDVIAAVTGGRLVLMTPDEVERSLGEPLSPGMRVRSFEELAESRHVIRAIVGDAFPGIPLNDVVLASGEALTNAVKHAGGGTYRLLRQDGCLQVSIFDQGPGIDFRYLPKATLTAGFSTKPSLGMGFTIMLELCERVMLTTQPGNTTVVLEMARE